MEKLGFCCFSCGGRLFDWCLLSLGRYFSRGTLFKGLTFTVRSNESGRLTAVLTAESTTARVLKRHGLKANAVLWSGRANATAGATKTLKLRLSRTARRALEGVQLAKLKLVVTVIDSAGNKRTITQHLRIRR